MKTYCIILVTKGLHSSVPELNCPKTIGIILNSGNEYVKNFTLRKVNLNYSIYDNSKEIIWVFTLVPPSIL